MNHINVKDALPDSRRTVLVWGHVIIMGIFQPTKLRFLGITKFNPSKIGGKFDICHTSYFTSILVTHWADIDHPKEML